LILKRLHSEGVSGTSAMPFGVFESGIQIIIIAIHLIFSHREEFLVNPQPGFRDDTDDVSQMLGRVEFDHLLFRPSDIVRPEHERKSNQNRASAEYPQKRRLLVGIQR
jgi:hypothetical protein